MFPKIRVPLSSVKSGSQVQGRWASGIIVWCLIAGSVSADDIYVRLNSNPFSSPFYIFSSSENGVSESIELTKGSTYVFIRTDSGHPFNVGSGWRTAHPELTSSSTGSGDAVSGVASIERGERLTVTIPENFSGSTVAYYCFPHSSMVANISVVSVPAGLDTDSDGILDSNGPDDDGDGLSDALEATIGTNPLIVDSDDDGVDDGSDAFPLNPNETTDTDSDGIGNNSDSDDDNDGYTDAEEENEGTDPLDANSAPMGGLSLILIKAFLDKQKADQ